MAAVVDLDLNRRPPSPEPAAQEELQGVMLRQEQPFPDQMDLPKLYWAQTNLPDGSFWKQSSDALSNLRSTHEHMMKNFDERGNPDVPSNSNKRKRRSDAPKQNMDLKSSIRRKPDVGVWEKCSYHNVIHLEKPATSDEVEIVSSSGFGKVANGNGRSQDGSCCVSPENCSLAESDRLCRERNASRVRTGLVGSSDTPDCQSPTKPNNTESRHSLIDLNVPLEESLHVSYAPSQEICSPLIISSSSRHGDVWSSSSKVFQKEYDSNIESMKESSIRVIARSSAADSSREVDVNDACCVQGKGLIDLNVSIGSIDMPSTITSDCTGKVLIYDENEGTVSSHSFSKKNSLQAETFREHPIVGYHHMLASQDDNNMLLPISTNDEINRGQSPDSETVNDKLLIPETRQVDNYVCPRLGASHDGASNPQKTVGMLQAETEESDKMASIAAETLLSIFSDNSACAADCPVRNSETAAQGGNEEPQRSLDSYEEIILNLEEIRDDGESHPCDTTR